MCEHHEHHHGEGCCEGGEHAHHGHGAEGHPRPHQGGCCEGEHGPVHGMHGTGQGCCGPFGFMGPMGFMRHMGPMGPMGAGPGPWQRHEWRRFHTRQERIAMLERYLEELRAEAQGVEERLNAMKAEG